MDYNLPGSSVHGILQARILEWVAISFSNMYYTTWKTGDNPKMTIAKKSLKWTEKDIIQ